MPAVSQRMPHRKSSRRRKSAVVSSTPRNNAADSRTSETSASDISSMRCIPWVAASAPAMALLANNPPIRCRSAVASRHPEADERIAAAQMMVEEGQGRADGEAVEPEGYLRQLDGQRILVDAVDTALEDHPPG